MTNHLLGDHHDSLGREPTVAMVEKVLKTRAEKVDDKNIVETLLSEVVDIGDTGCKQRLAKDAEKSSETGNIRHPTKIL